MTVAIWVLFTVLLVVWSGVVGIAVAVTRWAAQTLEDSASGKDLPASMSELPAWLTVWIPEDVLPGLQALLHGAAQLIESSLPWVGAAVGWLVPLIWIGWFLVALALLLVAVFCHVMVKRSRVSRHAMAA
ncbi:hypothetical protein LRS03_05190 [Rhizobacter sp. J219]|uniref:hypothetical protein n=1 Tax=Rhizobacter sp. J219 TaxID=2898430 RepID=UPI0021509692|nr:hypothetical protein [Rhizobacter sp. J219]MCR5882286.1 hypothetical protein [Rhizobacter sp. J219]